MTDRTPTSIYGERREWPQTVIHMRAPDIRHATDSVGLQSPALVFREGNSPAMQDIAELIRRFASCDLPVLITGESGTGKEFAAREIHDRSLRRTGEFVAVNCSEIAPTLIARQLFGYETGTSPARPGQVEHAHGGTLFLNEIGAVPIDLQGQLLRLLQRGEIVRVGGHEPIKVNVRIITATSLRLPHAIATGKLRDDLYYRLSVLRMHLPPLRERKGDIEVLVNHFVEEIARELGSNIRSVSPAAISAMEAHSWPGNVQELVATIRRAVTLSDSEEIQVANLGLDTALPAPSASVQISSRPLPGSDAERDLLLSTLQRNGSNIARTARELKVSRVTLYRMLDRNHLVLQQQYVVRDHFETATRSD